MMGEFFSSMSRQLMIPIDDLTYLARSAPYRYKVYVIDKKRRGEKRTIAQPAREIKRLQRYIVETLLAQYPVHEAAIAYREGRSIRDNAGPHAGEGYLLKLDFKDFFHSIQESDFRQLILRYNPLALDEVEIGLVGRILFWKRERRDKLILSIGAPSSPAVSNILLYEFDQEVSELCKQERVTYTRYADDLTFSASEGGALAQIERGIGRICQSISSPKLRINRKKTVHASKAAARRVTGLVLTNDGTVSIGHQRKRELHSAVHRFKHRKLDDEQAKSLAGYLAFVHSVEPEFLRVLTRRYGQRVMARLFKRNRADRRSSLLKSRITRARKGRRKRG